MYCKHCGKEISENSKFCQYCGGKLYDDTIEHPSIDIKISNTDIDPLKVEVLPKKKKDNSHLLANEFIANFKMIGIAIGIFLICMLFFYVSHQKDIKTYDKRTSTSYFGESRYDKSFISGDYHFDWEYYYYLELSCQWDIVCALSHKNNEYNIINHHYNISHNAEYYLRKARELEKLLKLSNLDIEKYKKEAHENVNREIARWNDQINSMRKYGFEKDFKTHAKYTSIILLVITIMGRYLIIFIKWMIEKKCQ